MSQKKKDNSEEIFNPKSWIAVLRLAIANLKILGEN
jgi:hypothetical protein